MPNLAVGRPALRRSRVCIRAQEEGLEDDRPEFSFKSNTRSGVGYIEEDSAGQTNIFAVQPKQYVAGSLDDETQDSSATAIVGVGGAVLALAVVGVGVTALTSLGGGNIVCIDHDTSAAAAPAAIACVSADPFPILGVMVGILSMASQL